MQLHSVGSGLQASVQLPQGRQRLQVHTAALGHRLARQGAANMHHTAHLSSSQLPPRHIKQSRQLVGRPHKAAGPITLIVQVPTTPTSHQGQSTRADARLKRERVLAKGTAGGMVTRETGEICHLSPVMQTRLALSPGGVAYASC